MGQCRSKALLTEHQARLSGLAASVEKASWRRGGSSPKSELRDLEQIVIELVGLSFFFDKRKGVSRGVSELDLVQRLCDKLVNVLLEYIQDLLVKRFDPSSISDVKRVARQLDAVRGAAASRLIAEKHLQVQASVFLHCANLVDLASRRLADLEAAMQATGHVVQQLKRCAELPPDTPVEAATVLSKCVSFGNKCVERMRKHMASQPSRLRAVQEAIGSLDAVCTSLAGSLKKKWEPLGPQIEAERTVLRADLLSSKLAAAEEEFAEAGQVDYAVVVSLLKDLAPFWKPPKGEGAEALGEEKEARLRSICEKMGAGIASGFDEALFDGSADLLDAIQALAVEYDGVLRAFQAEGALPCTELNLSGALAGKRAGVTLSALLSNTRRGVSHQAKVLKAARDEAEARLRKVPREQLDAVEAPVWKYKLRRGAFLDFSEETCAEVERHYQAWIAAGKPLAIAARRFTVNIQGVPTMTATSRSLLRLRCKFGEKCFRKNPKHRKQYSHPDDQDWDAGSETTRDRAPSVASSESPPIPTPSVGGTVRLSLDFHLMTQINLDKKGGLRNITRDEGPTKARTLTREYYELFLGFVRGVGEMLSQAVAELRLIGPAEQAHMQTEVDSLLDEMQPIVREFLSLALSLRDSKAIDEVVALLGDHTARLGVLDAVKDLRVRDVVKEMSSAYQVDSPSCEPPSFGRWPLLRLLLKHRLVKARLKLTETKEVQVTLRRRQVQMRCQALLAEFEGDDENCRRLRAEACAILREAMARMVSRKGSFRPDVALGIVRTAAAWQCDLSELLLLCGDLLVESVQSACRATLQPLDRVEELLDGAREVAKAAGRGEEEICDLSRALPLLAERAVGEVRRGVDMPLLPRSPSTIDGRATGSLREVVRLRGKLGPAAPAFDEALWHLIQPWYTELGQAKTQHVLDRAVAWVIAYCEQLRLALPPWMMSKDQAEALRKLRSALVSGDEGQLREAVVFAKQADCKADENLFKAYNDSMSLLQKLKRLPSSWQLEELMGDDAKATMFKQADLADPNVKGLFQRLFDKTTASITTRDRVGAVPRGYKVQRVVTVMNVESWFSYVKRRDEVSAQCQKFSAAAPCSEKVWDAWSGPIATSACSSDILEQLKIPALAGSANEFLLFHGTKPEAADLIAKNHFDMAFACKTGLFGAGLYFAEACSKSDEYVACNAAQHFPLIVARVILGRINYCADVDPVTDPGRTALESSCIGGSYHSVIGDRKKVRGTYREFIVYDHYQVYPHFIVWYTRV